MTPRKAMPRASLTMLIVVVATLLNHEGPWLWVDIAMLLVVAACMGFWLGVAMYEGWDAT